MHNIYSMYGEAKLKYRLEGELAALERIKVDISNQIDVIKKQIIDNKIRLEGKIETKK